jgi:hypothetical protein
MEKENLEEGLAEIRAKIADGSMDLYQGSIEARKIGWRFGPILDEVIDSWGGVPPKREEVPAS